MSFKTKKKEIIQCRWRNLKYTSVCKRCLYYLRYFISTKRFLWIYLFWILCGMCAHTQIHTKVVVRQLYNLFSFLLNKNALNWSLNSFHPKKEKNKTQKYSIVVFTVFVYIQLPSSSFNKKFKENSKKYTSTLTTLQRVKRWLNRLYLL